MNRADRRNSSHHQHPAPRPVNMDHGHNGTQVIVRFSRPIPNLALTLEQTEAFIAALQGSKERLIEHQKANNG